MDFQHSEWQSKKSPFKIQYPTVMKLRYCHTIIRIDSMRLWELQKTQLWTFRNECETQQIITKPAVFQLYLKKSGTIIMRLSPRRRSNFSTLNNISLFDTKIIQNQQYLSNCKETDL